MKFECNCRTPWQLRKMIKEVHASEWGTNFEVGARLWYTYENGSCIMIEYQISTLECRKLTGEETEPDWFTIYGVENENDYNCDNELYTETTGDFRTVSDLKAAMLALAMEATT